MAMTNPAPEYLGRKDSDRYCQLPQWAIRSGIYLSLTKNELKLYLFFVSKADKYSRETPGYTTAGLVERCKLNRKYIKPSVLSLAALKLIRPHGDGPRHKITVLFTPPQDSLIEKHQRSIRNTAGGKTLLNTSPLKAKVLNKRSPYEACPKLSQNLRHFVPESETFYPMPYDKKGHPPDWVTSQERIETVGDYEPGMDMEGV